MSPACCRVARRGTAAAGWVLPSVTLALLPKCPMCIAGYVAVATGLGISMTTAWWLRVGLILISVGCLIALVGRSTWRLVHQQRRR